MLRVTVDPRSCFIIYLWILRSDPEIDIEAFGLYYGLYVFVANSSPELTVWLHITLIAILADNGRSREHLETAAMTVTCKISWISPRSREYCVYVCLGVEGGQ